MPLTAGKHLSTVREWIQRKFVNGSYVTWGSQDYLSQRGSFTVLDFELLAENIRAVLMEEFHIKRSDHLYKYHIRCYDKGPFSGKADTLQEIWTHLFKAVGRVIIYENHYSTSEKSFKTTSTILFDGFASDARQWVLEQDTVVEKHE